MSFSYQVSVIKLSALASKEREVNKMPMNSLKSLNRNKVNQDNWVTQEVQRKKRSVELHQIVTEIWCKWKHPMSSIEWPTLLQLSSVVRLKESHLWWNVPLIQKGTQIIKPDQDLILTSEMQIRTSLSRTQHLQPQLGVTLSSRVRNPQVLTALNN